jgi:hypothetical protein
VVIELEEDAVTRPGISYRLTDPSVLQSLNSAVCIYCNHYFYVLIYLLCLFRTWPAMWALAWAVPVWTVLSLYRAGYIQRLNSYQAPFNLVTLILLMYSPASMLSPWPSLGEVHLQGRCCFGKQLRMYLLEKQGLN